MPGTDDEDDQLRAVALRNATAITRARRRVEDELLRTREALRESQERLTAALTAADTGTFRWTVGADALDGDDNLFRLFGLGPGSASRPLAAIIGAVHPDDRAQFTERLERSARDGAELDLEYRVVDADGAVRWIACRARTVVTDGGARRYMTGACADITTRRLAEQSMRDEARVLELLNRAGTMLASTLDLRAVVQAVTDAATELSGAEFGSFFYNTTDENGDAFLLYTLSGAPPEAFAGFGKPRATSLFGPTFRGEAPIRCADVLVDPRYGRMPPHHGMPKGHLPVRSYLAVPVRSRSGGVLGGLFFGHSQPGVFSERTERLIVGVAAQAGIAIDNARLYEDAQRMAAERKVLLEREQAARAAAEELSRVKDEFLTTLSHELRTPLNAILGWAHVLRSGSVRPEDVGRGLETIERNARAQAQLVEELLDVSRITSGRLRLDVEAIDPGPFISQAVDALRPSADARGIALTASVDAGAPLIAADAGRLHQVLWNLLSNAIKFTPPGGTISVAVHAARDGVEISVADTGVGISPDQIHELFERFRQGDPSTTRSYGGLGLGLSIVKDLVELHGGNVRMDSAGPGLGTTVTVWLPRYTGDC